MGACDLWDVLHDATVVKITTEPQDTIRLELECDYLRDRIADPGTRFFLILENCSCFAYRSWSDETHTIDDLPTIESRRLWVLSAERIASSCIITCSEDRLYGSGGKLEVAATKVRLTVDNGREVSLAEIEEVAEEYWSGFHARKNQE